MEKFLDLIKEDETVDDLGLGGLFLLQKKTGFRFGTDAVLLAHFAALKNRESVMDLCTGSGIIPILLAGKSTAKVIAGVELQAKYAEMAGRSVLVNELSDRVTIHQGDVKDLAFLDGLGHFDVVTCNPPYKEVGTGMLNPMDERMIARHEITIDLKAVIKGAALLLGNQGRLCLVHRPERLFEIVNLMRANHLEPKRIRLVAPSTGKVPNMLLVEGIKFAKPYLKWEPQLEIYHPDGSYTNEIKEIYNDGRH
ncbi:MAG: tRNA1(Val) (adenine(37)-N6)-methyltransferase [Clostridiaceae bacterium]